MFNRLLALKSPRREPTRSAGPCCLVCSPTFGLYGGTLFPEASTEDNGEHARLARTGDPETMLSAQDVLDEYFLDNRCMLIEVAAMLDRYDAAGGDQADDDPRLVKLRQAIDILADRSAGADRSRQLLRLFSDPVDD